MKKPPKQLNSRFWNKVNKTDTCWLWNACTTPKGYGLYYFDGKLRIVHRVAYECYKGEIPRGLQIDHLCRVRNCVNPEHLEAVTHRENLMRGESFASLNARKDGCVHGHIFTEESTRMYRGKRVCKPCGYIKHKAWKIKQSYAQV